MAAFLANQDLWHNLGSDRGELKKEEGTLLRRTEQKQLSRRVVAVAEVYDLVNRCQKLAKLYQQFICKLILNRKRKKTLKP